MTFESPNALHAPDLAQPVTPAPVTPAPETPAGAAVQRQGRFAADPGHHFKQGLGWAPWRTLMGQFLFVSAALLVLSMLAQGAWVASAIETHAKRHAAAAAAVYVDHFIAPLLSGLGAYQTLSSEQERALDVFVERASAGMRIVALKVWTADGKVLYSTDPRIVGQSFEPSAALRLAASGVVSAEFDELDNDESSFERAAGMPLLEIYVPVIDGAGRVAAVVEFYENAQALHEDIVASKREAWAVTALVCLAMIAGLSLIFNHASTVINRQRLSLIQKVVELSQALRQNIALQDRVKRASRIAAEENERFLHSLGADLHDGPAQTIGYALLRLDALVPAASGQQFQSSPELSPASEIGAIRAALADAMDDVRNICAGLSMPEIERLSLADALTQTIRAHERRTRSVVRWDAPELPASAPHFVKISLCRFVQESLNNAFRHAGGKGQQVVAWTDQNTLFVTVEDTGPGLPVVSSSGAAPRLGLAGLSNRIESWGGTIRVTSAAGKGTQLTAAMPMAIEEARGEQ